MSERVLNMALSKFVKTASENPQTIDIFEKITKVIELPLQEFSEMLITPVLEEFHEAMAPIYDALAPLMEDLTTVIFAIAMPIMKAINTILKYASDFMDSVRKLTGAAGVEDNSEYEPIDPSRLRH